MSVKGVIRPYSIADNEATGAEWESAAIPIHSMDVVGLQVLPDGLVGELFLLGSITGEDYVAMELDNQMMITSDEEILITVVQCPYQYLKLAYVGDAGNISATVSSKRMGG